MLLSLFHFQPLPQIMTPASLTRTGFSSTTLSSGLRGSPREVPLSRWPRRLSPLQNEEICIFGLWRQFFGKVSFPPSSDWVPQQKWGKYSGGVKSEILNSTEQNFCSDANFHMKWFSHEKRRDLKNHTFWSWEGHPVELHNFGLITEHNLSKCREGGLKLFISQNNWKGDPTSKGQGKTCDTKTKKILETKLLELYLFCKPPWTNILYLCFLCRNNWS